MNYLNKVVIVFFYFIFSVGLMAQPHPNIMLTKQNIQALREGVEKYPILKTSYDNLKAQADLALANPIDVPTPADAGGGSTHERHKKNYHSMLQSGIAYQVTGDKKYANYVKEMLLRYAHQYQKWPVHPMGKSNEVGGRIFWQELNDCVWQVYTIQAYDMVYEAISVKDRNKIEEDLFIPILTFLTEDRYDIFNMIHNHGTWTVAAVGMTGYVLNKPEYVEMALKGSNKDGKTGYLTQIDRLFSPDGYYMEGPYYQRYALLPFVLFAKAIHNYQPELQIFEYRDKLLAKAIQTSLQLTYTDGTFFPINDAIKDKTFETTELVYGLNIAYADIKEDYDLLDIAKKQGQVTVSDAGLVVARAIAERKAIPFRYTSQWIRDGGNGDEGGLAILRNGDNEDQQCLLIKAASQGMGHGHFDRLNLLYYDNNTEMFYDYGAARFLNIVSKRGGRYLPENNSWAKQTVAHNTLVVDRTSHFDAKVSHAEKYHPELIYFSNSPALQAVSAKETNAYPDVDLHRTSMLIRLPANPKALLLDIFMARSDKKHAYDLPFWYKGHIVDASFKPQTFTSSLTPLGTKNGYQHIWLNAENQLETNSGYISVLNNKRFYTTHFTAENPLTVKLLSIGANDPEMNLVEGKAFMLSQNDISSQTFVSLTETHGNVDPVNETIVGSESVVKDLKLVKSDPVQTVVSFGYKGTAYNVEINYQDKENFVRLITIDK